MGGSSRYRQSLIVVALAPPVERYRDESVHCGKSALARETNKNLAHNPRDIPTALVFHRMHDIPRRTAIR